MGQTIDDCTKAMELNPNDAVSYLNRGIAYKLQSNKAKATADFEKTITLSSNPRLIEMARQQLKELSQ